MSEIAILRYQNIKIISFVCYRC